MALVGDLRNINLGDIFQTLGMNRQVGTLIVRDAIQEIRLFFSENGVAVCSSRSTKDSRIGTFLVQEGALTGEDLLAALRRQKEQGGLIGDRIVEMGCCGREVIDNAIRYQAASLLYELFFWQEGEFEFIERPTPTPADAASPYINRTFDPSGVVMEAARRIDEWGLVRRAIPEESEFFVPSGTEPPDGAAPTQRHRTILALADGTRDVTSIYRDSHLARFDAGSLLLELLKWEVIRAATTDELLTQAWAFFDQRKPEPAVLCLTRAHERDPSSARVLELLVHCYEALEERRLASEALRKLGNLRFIAGEAGEAVTALDKACRYAPNCAETRILLSQIYSEIGDRKAAADRAAQAAEILAQNQQWETSIKVCREALRGSPEDITLRIHLVNALQAMGFEDKALAELEEVVEALERTKAPRELEEIYKKILVLDPSRTQYLRRLQGLQSTAVKRKKLLVRVAAISGVAAAVIAIATLLFGGSSSARATLSDAWSHFDGGDLDRAATIARDVITQHPDSDEAIEAQNLLAAIQTQLDGGPPEQASALKHLEESLERRFQPAQASFEKMQYSQGFDQLMQLVVFYEGAECRDALRRIGSKARSIQDEYRNSVRALLDRYSAHLELLASVTRMELSLLKEVDLMRSDLETIRKTRDEAQRVRDAAAGENRHKNQITAEAVETAMFEGPRTADERLKRACSDLEEIRNESNEYYHRTRAQLLKREIFLDFSSALKQINDMKNRGGLQQARDVCREFLARCYELDRQSPPEIYRPIAQELFADDGADLDGRIQQELRAVDQVIQAIAHGNELVGAGRYDEANRHLRELLRSNFRIDFSDHVRLVALVKTRPVGAQVSSRHHFRNEQTHGRTARDHGVLVRYHPYGITKILVHKESFEPVEVAITGFADNHPATMEIDLEKKLEWRKPCGPVQGSPTEWHDSILIASRDGHLRSFQKSDGTPRVERDFQLLVGLAFRPLVEGSRATISTRGRDLLSMDLESDGGRWTFTAEAPLATGPVSAEGGVVVADEDGRLYAVRGGHLLWQKKMKSPVRSAPAIQGGNLYVCATAGTLARIDVGSGEVRWEVDAAGPIYSSPVVVNDRLVLVCTEAARVLAYSVADGSQAWALDLDDSVAGEIISYGDLAFAVTLHGTVTMILAATGEVLERQTISVEGPFTFAPSVHNGSVYAVSADGTVVAFSPAYGRLWSYKTGETPAGPGLICDGRLFLATSNGNVLCFSLAGDG